MTIRNSILAGLGTIGLIACQVELALTDPDQCFGKCDSAGDQAASADLMRQAPLPPAKLEISRNKGGKWLCELIGAKGEAILSSDTEYEEKAGAIAVALSVEENGIDAANYEVVKAGGRWKVVLRAPNGVVLLDSPLMDQAQAQGEAAKTRDLVARIVQYRTALEAKGARFRLEREGEGHRFVFKLLDADKKLLLTSQTYERRRDAVTGILSVRENGKIESRYELFESGLGFRLKARNGEEIGRAQFSSREETRAAMSATQSLLRSERVANPW